MTNQHEVDDLPVGSDALPAPIERARRRLIVRRLPRFAAAWLASTAMWGAVMALQSRDALLPAVAIVIAQAALLAAVGRYARNAHEGRGVRAALVVTCVGLGASSTLLLAAAGGDADVLAFILLTLFLAAAQVFAWGWRAEALVLTATLVIAAPALPYLQPGVPRPLLATAVLIGAAVSLAIAEASARAFAVAFRHRASDTRRKRELEASRDAYRDLAENARDFVYSGDVSGRITYVNEATARFFGVGVADLVGRRFHDFMEPHAENPDLDAVLAWLAAGENVPPLTFATRTNVGVRWMEVLPSAIVGADGRVVGARGIGRDVTDRKRAAEALRESEERFRNVFGSAPIGMAIVRLDGHVVQVNRALCAMLGYEAAELAGASLDGVSGDDAEASLAGMGRRLCAGAGTVDVERRYRHKDGRTVWGHVSASLMHHGSGEPAYLVVQVQDITMRKAAERALRESERRYRGLVESQHDLIARFDVDMRLTFVNDAYCAKLGRTREELLGGSWLPLVHPEDVPAIADVLPYLKAPPHRACVDARSLTPEGERWIAWEASAIKDSEGRTIEIQAVGRDVTERRNAERALRESEQRFRSAFDSASIGMVVVATDGRATQVNRAFCAMTGYQEDELLGARFEQVTHPDDVAATLAHVEEALRGGSQSYHLEKRYRHKAGHTVWGLLSSALVRDGRGEPLYFISQIQDITERKRAEEALRKSEERYRGLVESQHDLIARFDAEGRYTFVNDVYCRTFGLGRDELLGRRFSDFVHPDDLGPTLSEIAAAARPPYRGEVENRQRTVAGWRWIAWEGCTIRDPKGRTVEVQSVGRDVTERRVAEEALRASLDELRRSEERLRLLAQRQATIREEERKRLGFDLHDNVCQELIGISIIVESLRRRSPSIGEGEAAELDRVVRYLHELVEHLRLLARDMRPMLLRDLGLEGSLRSLADGMSSSATRVAAEFATPIPRLDEAIELAVYRIAQEALANAARHARAHSIVTTLAVHDDRLHLAVRDDGRGFDPAHGRSEALGLVSMRERALALGGRFEVTSAPGEGTVVRFECPVAASPMAPPLALVRAGRRGRD